MKLLDTVFLHKIYYVPKVITNTIVLKQNKYCLSLQAWFSIYSYTCHYGKAFLRAIFTLNSFIIRRHILIFLFFPSGVPITVFLPAPLLSLYHQKGCNKKERKERRGKNKI